MEGRKISTRHLIHEYGTNAKLTCNTLHNIKWFLRRYDTSAILDHGYGSGMVNMVGRNTTLTLESVDYNNMGKYYCYGLTHEGKAVMDDITVIIYG